MCWSGRWQSWHMCLKIQLADEQRCAAQCRLLLLCIKIEHIAALAMQPKGGKVGGSKASYLTYCPYSLQMARMTGMMTKVTTVRRQEAANMKKSTMAACVTLLSATFRLRHT